MGAVASASPGEAPSPIVRLRGTSFARRVAARDECDDAEFRAVEFEVHDSLGGESRSVPVAMALRDDSCFLRAVSPLPKREFELVFAFDHGEFCEGRTVCVPRSDLVIE